MIRRLTGSNFVRNVSTLVSGRVAAVLLSFVSTPIIARLFNPDDFGVAVLFFTIVMLIGGISTLNYQSALLMSMSERRSRMLRRLSFLILTTVTVSCYLFMALIALSPVEFPMLDSFGAWVWVMPLAVWMIGAKQIGDKVLARAKLYKASSLAVVGQSAGTVGGRLSLGYLFGSTVSGLIVGRLLGLITELGIIWSHVIRLPRERKHRMTGVRLKAVAAEYRDFPLLNVPANLLSEVSIKLPILVMGPWLGMEVVGFYAMASRLVGLPLSLAGNSFRVVMLQKVSEVRSRGGNLQVLYLQAFTGLIVTGIVPFCLLWAFGAEVLGIILGDNWVEAGRYVEVLAPWYFATWVGALVPPFLTALRRQGIWLVIQVMMLVGRVGAFAYGYWIDASVEVVLQVFVWTNVALAKFMVLVGFVETRKSTMIRA